MELPALWKKILLKKYPGENDVIALHGGQGAQSLVPQIRSGLWRFAPTPCLFVDSGLLVVLCLLSDTITTSATKRDGHRLNICHR